MTGFLSLRLACRNIRRNHQTYGPFLLATSLLTFALYAFLTMSYNRGLAQAEVGGVMFTYLLTLGSFVVAVFTYIFLFYANSFLIKRRKTEFGLYGVLGMERRHIVAVMFCEMLVMFILTMALGMGVGALLTRLLSLILRWLTKLDTPLETVPSSTATFITAVLISFLFLILFIYNAFQVRLAKPIDLLHAKQQGEKEPKARWLFTLIGLAAMISGYVIALRVSNPITALGFFFVAVLLVILGTYLLFMTGSIALLKTLRAKKSFYYKPKHFVNISGMMFRMKQNAAGLASIAILCTMAMVTFGSTGALYLSIEKVLNDTYPTDIRLSTDSAEAFEAMLQGVEQANEETGLTIRKMDTYRYFHTALVWEGDGFVNHLDSDIYAPDYYDRYYQTMMIPLEDFNAVQGTDLTLADNELGLYCSGILDSVPLEEGFPLNGQTWIGKRIKSLPVRMSDGYNTAVGATTSLILVVPNWDTMVALAEANPYFRYLERTDLRWCAAFDLNANAAELIAYYPVMRDAVFGAIRESDADLDFSLGDSSKAIQSKNVYTLFGTLLFIGVFLGLIFLMGTALIIYFKQISEGHQDRDRFSILQKVGMDQKMVRRCVRQQVLLVFFLPLAVALIHVVCSLHLISLMLQAFQLSDAGFIKLCSIGSALIVAAVYLAFYGQTAHSYYKLVRLEVKS